MWVHRFMVKVMLPWRRLDHAWMHPGPSRAGDEDTPRGVKVGMPAADGVRLCRVAKNTSALGRYALLTETLMST